jgi:hypothetical protein
MPDTNKNDSNKAAVLASLDTVRQALNTGPASPEVAEALAQCDRLQLAIQQFHAEGLRFAAFTLLRMVQSKGTVFTGSVQQATRDLKAVLDIAGYPH